MSNNDALLAELGWAKQLNVQEIEGDSFVEDYCGWEIRLCIPNGGIIGVSIWDKDKDYWWCTGTDDEFDYHDDEGIVAYAKISIDKVVETFKCPYCKSKETGILPVNEPNVIKCFGCGFVWEKTWSEFEIKIAIKEYHLFLMTPE